MHMQGNVAYNNSTQVLSNQAADVDEVYDTVDPATLTGSERVEPVVFNTKKRRFLERYLYLTLVIVVAVVLVALTVSMLIVQITNISNQELTMQMCAAEIQNLKEITNRTSNTFKSELSVLQQTIVEQQATLSFNLSNLQDNFRVEFSSLQGNISSQLNELIRLLKPEIHLCGGSGWRRVAFIDMVDPNQDCPQGLNLTDYSIRSCGRAHTGTNGCSSVTFSVDGPQYTQVCGRVTAYRQGFTAAFFDYHSQAQTIDGAYVDGLSLTHGSPQTHIWTFASGIFSGTSGDGWETARCPCDPGNTYGPPTFVGNDYVCESILTSDNWTSNPLQFIPDNALWDGQDNISTKSCYDELNNPPWFDKTLPAPTSDDIEFRLCFTSWDTEADIGIQLMELYVQ